MMAKFLIIILFFSFPLSPRPPPEPGRRKWLRGVLLYVCLWDCACKLARLIAFNVVHIQHSAAHDGWSESERVSELKHHNDTLEAAVKESSRADFLMCVARLAGQNIVSIKRGASCSSLSVVMNFALESLSLLSRLYYLTKYRLMSRWPRDKDLWREIWDWTFSKPERIPELTHWPPPAFILWLGVTGAL